MSAFTSNAIREIADTYTLAQISASRKEATAQGDTCTAFLLAQAYDLRFSVLVLLIEQDYQGRHAGGVNVQ